MVFDDPAPGEVDVSIDDPFDWLLKRTELFASSISGKKGVFTPHPATWFNQDRFDDDPAEWNRTEESSRPEPERWEVEF